MKKRIILTLILTFAICSLLLTSCSKDEINNEETSNEKIVNRKLYEIMKDLYLWYDKLPVVNLSHYRTPQELMSALRYDSLDRWSFVLSWDEYYQYFQAGKMVGHGFMISRDEDYNLRIAFIYPSTLAYSNGIRRGWMIKEINGLSANPENVIQLLGESNINVTNTIGFIDNDGFEKTIILKKQEISLNPILHSEIISTGGKKIGYIVFQDFIGTANPKIDSVFSVFSIENVDDLILDMRYNGGGSVDVAIHLAGWLTGNTNANKTLVKILHNNKINKYDTLYRVPHNNASLDLNRIAFIGTNATASASELIINGMVPFMDVTLVGTPTDGKPVGMYVLDFEKYNYAAFPVSFRYTNARDEGDFYDGIQPDILVNDDVTKDFGDPNEGMLKAALNYITSGTTTVTVKKSTVSSQIVRSASLINEFQRAF